MGEPKPTNDNPPSYEVESELPGAREAVWHGDQQGARLRLVHLEDGTGTFSVRRCGVELRLDLTAAQLAEMVRFLENTDIPSREPDDDMLSSDVARLASNRIYDAQVREDRGSTDG